MKQFLIIYICGAITYAPIFFVLGYGYAIYKMSKGHIKKIRLKGDIVRRIVALLFVGLFILPVTAGDPQEDLKKFEEERKQIVARIEQYEQVIQNNKYRLAQLDALIEYAQGQITKETKKETKPKK